MARKFTERADSIPRLAEVFREYGYDGSSIALICKATRLGKGSLYNFFPGGKSEMLTAVLGDIDTWFETAVFHPLDHTIDARAAIMAMFDAVTEYFRSGERVCLMGALGMGRSRDPFGDAVAGYFSRWIAALAKCLTDGSVRKPAALSFAEDVVAGIQGAIVLSRALDDREVFQRTVSRHKTRLIDLLDWH